MAFTFRHTNCLKVLLKVPYVFAVHFPAKVPLRCNEPLVPLPGNFAPLLVLSNHSLECGFSPNPTWKQ